MLVVHVDIHVLPEAVEVFKAATLINASNSVQEPGIVRFDVLQDNDDPTHFVLAEVYRTAEATVAHRATAHFATWLATLTTMLARPRTRASFTNVFPPDADW